MNESKNFNQDFSLSKEALERVKILLNDEEGSYFRISVLGGGCSGFQYDFSFDKKPTAELITNYEKYYAILDIAKNAKTQASVDGSSFN